MFVAALLFVFGGIVGSFCNVLIYRLHSGDDFVYTRSRCRACKKHIAWYDNVPVVSFILLRGVCRRCGVRIAWQYPLVEIVVAILFGVVGFFFAIGSIVSVVATAMIALSCAGLVVVFVYDARHMEIPMGVMWAVIGFLIVANGSTDVASGAFTHGLLHTATVTHGLSALAAFCFFFALSYISDETWMGYGDAFVAIAVGLLCGPIGTFVALLIAFCIGSVYGISLTLLKRATMKSAVPFGPFLIIGAITTFILVHSGVQFDFLGM